MLLLPAPPFAAVVRSPPHLLLLFLLRPACRLRVAVVGGGPAGASAAEALVSTGVHAFLFERSPAGTKPGVVVVDDEFSIPLGLVNGGLEVDAVVSADGANSLCSCILLGLVEQTLFMILDSVFL